MTLSIIICTANRESELLRCINSISIAIELVNFDNIELLIIDDGLLSFNNKTKINPFVKRMI